MNTSFLLGNQIVKVHKRDMLLNERFRFRFRFRLEDNLASVPRHFYNCPVTYVMLCCLADERCSQVTSQISQWGQNRFEVAFRIFVKKTLKNIQVILEYEYSNQCTIETRFWYQKSKLISNFGIGISAKTFFAETFSKLFLIISDFLGEYKV